MMRSRFLKPMSAKVRKFILTSALVFFGLLLSLWIMLRVFDPGPKGRIVLATGGAGGIYHALGQDLIKDAARLGVDIQLRPDIEGMSTIAALLAARGQVDGGFVKGGVAGSLQGRFASPGDRKLRGDEVDSLQSLGRLMHEPLWVFYRGPAHVKHLGEFKGRRIYIGTAASGSRLIASQLLRANGIDETNTTLLASELPDDALPLMKGEIDVAFVIGAPELPKVQKLLRVSNILLMDFSEVAEAYTGRFPYLTKVVLRRGAVEFAPELPTADITLLSTEAALVVRKDLHPALVSILTNVMLHNPKAGFDADGDPILFYKAGEFPVGKDPEFDVAPEAAQVYKSTEIPLLLRSVAPINKRLAIPFWVSAFVDQHGTQTILLLIPLLSILLPMFRFLPVLYNWNIKRRLIFWYDKLKALEASIDHDPSKAHVALQVHELDRIDGAVRRIRVPSHAADQLYDLRGHVELVRQKIMPRASVETMAGVQAFVET